jgi:hypothetical protein
MHFFWCVNPNLCHFALQYDTMHGNKPIFTASNMEGIIMFCTNCGTKLGEANAFCTQCGARVVKSPATNAVPAQQAQAQIEPARNAPVQSVPVQSAPVQSAPVQSVPVQSVPVSNPVPSANAQTSGKKGVYSMATHVHTALPSAAEPASASPVRGSYVGGRHIQQ